MVAPFARVLVCVYMCAVYILIRIADLIYACSPTHFIDENLSAAPDRPSIKSVLITKLVIIGLKIQTSVIVVN